MANSQNNDAEKKDSQALGFEALVGSSEKFKELQRECSVAVKLSLTGITNLVVKYEDPCLVDCFLKTCFKTKDLYKGTYEIDAVELQCGRPGQGLGIQYIDSLIFGTPEESEDSQGLASIPKTDAQTGKRKRKPDGFVNRREVLTGTFEDRLLVIKNIDYSEFCPNKPGVIDPRALWIFDNFRNPSIKKGCRLLLVTNKKLSFPFKVRTINFDPVDDFEARHIIDSFIRLYKSKKYKVDFSDSQKEQMVRKLCGLTYTEAGDALGESMSRSPNKDNSEKKIVDANRAVKNLRCKINRNFMEDAVGLTHLSPKPWEDYICPESSNFTYDVKKIVRDFNEINDLKIKQEEIIEASKKDKSLSDVGIVKNIEAIRARMPHVLILYGRGGVGKSAFPVHFAGLLDFDVWDFNIGASHSKWVGEGPERMREALAKISKATHLIVRIDEYDRAIGSTAASGQGMHEAHKQVEAEFMNWLQNSQEENFFVKNDIFLVLTTNHKENITGPLMRSGRADLVMDIADFDEKSMRESFLTAPRRMASRGVNVVDFSNMDNLQKAIEGLDLDRLVGIASRKGFTVRDVDMLILEMAAHNYYFKKNKQGIQWSTESFVKVLENSIGSARSEETSELVLGDRSLMEEKQEEIDAQLKFPFDEECSTECDIEAFTQKDAFE